MTDKTSPGAETTLTIPPPRADRPPLRANIFESTQKGNTKLLPLFPHVYRGAMVPAGAAIQGGPDADHGSFFHANTVDEVTIAWAANGALIKTGQVFVGGRVHGVDSFLKDEKNPESFAVMCITQRQLEQGAQTEAVIFNCEECRKEVYRRDFDANPPDDGDESATVVFTTIPETLFAAEEFNADAALRTCKNCGHVNSPFPVKDWGWDHYASQTDTIVKARELLRSESAAHDDG